MGAMMEEACSGCGFIYPSGELFTHENECDMVIRNRLEETTAALAARDAEIERLRSLVEKRERQLVWAAKYGCAFKGHDGEWKLAELSDTGGDALFDGTDAGLLAAIDEATEPR